MIESCLNLLESSPIAQFAIGLDHKIIFWNKACEILTSRDAGEMIGTDRQWQEFYPAPRPTLADLVLDNDQQAFLRLYGEKKPAKSKIIPNAWEATDFFEDIGGKPRFIYFLAAPIFGPEGEIIGALETLQDISDQKRLEQEILQYSQQLQHENQKLKKAMGERFRFGSIIGKSESMQEVYRLIGKAAASEANVTIYGESGTGKELVARAIHDLSDRAGHNFVTVHCGAIPETLIESEFFGHKKGAFTGAHYNHPGYLDQADGGTLFLDEIGEISPGMQVKLLRVIDRGDYTPVGSTIAKKTDVRLVAATNRDLTMLLAKGLIREDFFYRIHVIPIHLPPLRQRKEDLRLLVDHFLEKFNTGNITLPENIRAMIQTHDWPGNVRELQNVLQRYLTLERIDIPVPIDSRATTLARTSEPGPDSLPAIPLKEAQVSFEKNLLADALRRHHWHKTKTAAAMGISRRTLFRKMKRFGL